jgi:hypothetical protein
MLATRHVGCREPIELSVTSTSGPYCRGANPLKFVMVYNHSYGLCG